MKKKLTALSRAPASQPAIMICGVDRTFICLLFFSVALFLCLPHSHWLARSLARLSALPLIPSIRLRSCLNTVHDTDSEHRQRDIEWKWWLVCRECVRVYTIEWIACALTCLLGIIRRFRRICMWLLLFLYRMNQWIKGAITLQQLRDDLWSMVRYTNKTLRSH